MMRALGAKGEHGRKRRHAGKKQGVQERLEPGREKAAGVCLAAEIHSK